MKDEQVKECVRLLGMAILSARPDTARALVAEAKRQLDPPKAPEVKAEKDKKDKKDQPGKSS